LTIIGTGGFTLLVIGAILIYDEIGYFKEARKLKGSE